MLRNAKIVKTYGLFLQSGFSVMPQTSNVKSWISDTLCFLFAPELYNLLENAAQSVGPLVFRYALLIGVGRGLMVIAVVLAGLAL